MKNKSLKILIIVVGIVLLSVVVMALPVNKKQLSEKVDTAENTTEAVTTVTETTTVITTEITTTMTTVTTTTETERSMIVHTVDLNLGEEDEYSFNSDKFINISENGRYYSVENGGRVSSNYVLCFEDSEGNQTVYGDTEDTSWRYFDGDTVYMLKDDWIKGDYNYKYCKVENGEFVILDEDAESKRNLWFTEEYIYYVNKAEDDIAICRMDYNWENSERIIEFDETENLSVCINYVYENKILYSLYVADEVEKGICYDLETGESVETTGFNTYFDVKMNNGYIYFYDMLKDGMGISRINMETLEKEILIENIDDATYRINFGFVDKYIIFERVCKIESEYVSEICLYDGKEIKKICSSDNIGGKEYSFCQDIQCQDGRIFLQMGIGGLYMEIVEIDIDANVLDIIPQEKYSYEIEPDENNITFIPYTEKEMSE